MAYVGPKARKAARQAAEAKDNGKKAKSAPKRKRDKVDQLMEKD